MKFLDGLSDDIRKNLLQQLRILWTHASTAIEGNTLNLSETAFVLREGLTISGKPLKDHKDVEGHALAVDLMGRLVEKEKITPHDLFDLHRLVITEKPFDVYKPVGAWKMANNSSVATVENRSQIIEYSNFFETPGLMSRWLDLLESECRVHHEPPGLVSAYARLHMSFVGIHPFFDGNGRLARLISNLPCLKAGYPPIIIDKESRYDYVTVLARYQLSHGVPSGNTELVVDGSLFHDFAAFCGQCWESTLSLVAEARVLQQKRNESVPLSRHEERV